VRFPPFFGMISYSDTLSAGPPQDVLSVSSSLSRGSRLESPVSDRDSTVSSLPLSIGPFSLLFYGPDPMLSPTTPLPQESLVFQSYLCTQGGDF